ncbi:MAG TPA: polysaccharide biosynthesis tyrosine autokinase [Isosphaeraceae bacterium]|nr:polysaccharide biosynthesis tyrosine autokinase [Isosphaeraceae bacterium]
MDTPDRSEAQPEQTSYLPPAPLSGASSTPRPAAAWNEPAPAYEPDPPTSPAFNPKIILRAIRRHWWQILLLWSVGSAVLMTLVYYKIKPTYEATAWLKVEPTTRSLMAQSYMITDFEPFLETQVLLVESPDVLGAAIQDPKVSSLPQVVRSLDPEVDLRKEINVAIQKGTHLIFVTMNTENPSHGPQIINAVVDAYKKTASTWSDTEMQEQRSRLQDLRKGFADDVTKYKEQLLELGRTRNSIESSDEGTVTLEQYRQFQERLAEVQMARYGAEAMLAYLKNDLQRQNARPSPAQMIPSEALETEIRDEFRLAPGVAQLIEEMSRLQDQLQRAERLARTPSIDPVCIRYKKELAAARADYDALWKRMYPRLKQRLVQSDDGENAKLQLARQEEIHRLETEIVKAQNEEKHLSGRIDQLRVETREANNEALEMRLVEASLSSSRQMLDTIDKNLQQIDYEMSSGTTINIIARAKESGMPTSTSRTKVMAATPVGVLGLVLSLFVLLEMRSGRVADPDDLPSRVRLDVLGVVPPLPAMRPARSLRGQRDERRRVEEFVQSLDHLRVALYADRPDGSQRRCILITSAIGGEGKTTLAAQLAGRCANAGLLTLLVDADLRRPSLGDLLEVPEGPGLAEVLANEVEPEAAMVVIGNAGGFHLLPAGQPGHDPSRLLHGERLAQLIGQFRSTFDVVIVDAPPVLAVPDALLLGRWTDGAVLAVRHDTSRFPLVERANRRLLSVGVPVLGAVVNGIRTMESNYGAYQYNPYASRGTEADPA